MCVGAGFEISSSLVIDQVLLPGVLEIEFSCAQNQPKNEGLKIIKYAKKFGKNEEKPCCLTCLKPRPILHDTFKTQI